MTPPPRPEPETLLAHAAFVASIARATLRGDDLADDVVQETWVAALQGGPKHEGALKSWLWSVTRRQAANLVRKQSAQRRRDKRAARPNPTSPSTAELVIRAETGRTLVAAVLSLDEIYRESLLLRYYEGLSPSQIAEHLGVPQETVRTRLKRGVQKLRDQLESEFGGGQGGWIAALTPMATLQGMGTGATAAAGVGGVVVAKKVAIGALLVLLGLGVVLDPLDLLHDPGASTPERNRPGDLQARGPDVPELHGTGKDGGSAGGSAGTSAPPGIDLDSVDRERDLHGVVVQERDGKPVAGATLQVVAYRWQGRGIITRGHHRDERLGAKTRSAVDGTFSLPLERGEVVGLRVDAPGFARMELRSLQAGERVKAVLSRGINLRVRITDEMGSGISGASVRMFGGDHREMYRVEETAKGGVAAFDRLVGGVQVTLDAKHPQYGDSGWTRYTLPPDGTAEKTLVLPRGRTIRGRITDVDTGEPIPGAQVGMGYTATNRVSTDGDGRYVLPGWTGKGVSTLTALAQGYGVKNARVDDRDVIDFELPVGAAVTGRVVDARGQPVEGAQLAAISVQNVKLGYATSKRIGFTDAAGQFKLDSIRPDLDLRLAAMRDGYGRYSVRILAERLSTTPLNLGDLELVGSRSVSGVVLDSNGDPAARLPVTIGHIESGSNAYRPNYTFGRVMSLNTDDLGRFYFRDLIPGPHRISVRAKGQSDIKQAVTVPEAEDLAGLRIVVPATRVLRVSVRTTEGRPLPELSIHVQGKDNYRTSASIDEDGVAVVHLRAEAEYVGLGFPEGTFSRYVGVTNQRITPGQGEVQFVLQEARPAKGTVVGPDGKSMARLSIAAEVGGERVVTRESNEEGQFEIPIPLGARADLVITGRASRKTSTGGIQGFTVPYGGRLGGVRPGEEGLVLHVRKLEENRSLRVRVLLPSGAPARGAFINVLPSLPGTPGKRADDAGRVELTGLPNAPVTILAHYFAPDLPDGVDAVMKGVMPEGQEVTLHIREGMLLSGVVSDAEGAPLAGVEVRVQQKDQHRWHTTQSSGDGSWSLRLAPEDGELVTVAAAFTASDGKQLAGSIEGVRVGSRGVRLILTPSKEK